MNAHMELKWEYLCGAPTMTIRKIFNFSHSFHSWLPAHRFLPLFNYDFHTFIHLIYCSWLWFLWFSQILFLPRFQFNNTTKILRCWCQQLFQTLAVGKVTFFLFIFTFMDFMGFFDQLTNPLFLLLVLIIAFNHHHRHHDRRYYCLT